MFLVKVYLGAPYFLPWNVPPWPLGSGRDMLYIGPNSKKKKVLLLIYLTTVKQSITNAYSCFRKKRNKATHGYLITLALRSRGDMLYVGHSPGYTESVKNVKLYCLFI